MTFNIWEILIPTIEVLILWIVFYRILVFFEGTRAFQVLKGIFYLLIVFLVSQIFGFEVLNWLLTKFFGLSIIAILIIFQQELRQGLARLGQGHLFNIGLEEAELVAVIEELTSATFKLSNAKIGCLIAIERQTKLKTYIESGVMIDGKVTGELIKSVFSINSPLHDGGAIVRGDRIIAASCLFPLSDNPNFNKTMGTRHRAALGLSEQTDAVVIVVSEETCEISTANDGRLVSISHRDQLVQQLKNFLVMPKRKKT